MPMGNMIKLPSLTDTQASNHHHPTINAGPLATTRTKYDEAEKTRRREKHRKSKSRQRIKSFPEGRDLYLLEVGESGKNGRVMPRQLYEKPTFYCFEPKVVKIKGLLILLNRTLVYALGDGFSVTANTSWIDQDKTLVP